MESIAADVERGCWSEWIDSEIWSRYRELRVLAPLHTTTTRQQQRWPQRRLAPCRKP